ncbi:MAG: GIY-YIG nuclease family protein [Hydrogenophilus sp.]|nr:GIY-YIG nuclease family protein [Hydrogenophilus sp.]
MSQTTGFSVRIFLPTGNPEGLRILEKSNWTGQGWVFPRTLFADVRKRDALRRTGVYILWGLSPDKPLPRVYVGEGDGVLTRLEQHAKQKDFWTHAVVFISKDQNLNKAHVQYLEARLVELAAAAKRCDLDKANQPQLPKLSEADAADAEGFLADMLLCLPLVGLTVFEAAVADANPACDLWLKTKGLEARGNVSAEGFIVRAGSSVSKQEVPSTPAYLKELRATLLNKGVLVDEGTCLRFTQDFVFNSPSTAAGVVLGRSANGRIEWKDGQGHTLKQIQDAELT